MRTSIEAAPGGEDQTRRERELGSVEYRRQVRWGEGTLFILAGSVRPVRPAVRRIDIIDAPW